MSYQVNVDFFCDLVVPGSGTPAVVERGREFSMIGWAADVAAGTIPRAVYAIVDDFEKIQARLRDRRDVAGHFGNQALVGAGFDIGFPTNFLSVGEHRIRLLIEAADGTTYDYGANTFSVAPARPQAPPPKPRIIIAGAPKSATNFTETVLRRYFGAGDVPPGEEGGGYNLDSLLVDRLRGRAFVAVLHMKPHLQNLLVAKKESIDFVVTWRNLGDMIVSLDDYLHLHTGPNFIFHMDPAYLRMPDQDRYRLLVQHVVPWYVSFYVGWRETGAPISRYEEVAADPHAAFSALIAKLAGSVDRDRLTAAIEAPMSAKDSNKNVGINYRSLDKLAEPARTMIEELISDYPEPIGELLAELPWRAKTAAG